MKFVWMPHCFFADMSITYMLVRYAYYVVAYILIMLFLQWMLHMSAKKCFHLGIGCLFIRLLIDIFAYILVLCFDLNEWIIIYYFLDAFYLISSGLYVFYGLSVKARKAVSKPFKIIAGISILLLVVLVIMVQSEIIYIAEKYIKDIANTISSTLLAFVNKSIVDDDVFYRVCIGAFKNKSNAILLKNEAISKGFSDAYIY